MPEEEKIWSVTELNGIMRDIVDGSLRPMWVSGEVGNLTLHRSGHAYMTLKDASSQIKAVYFGGANECAKLKVREGSQIEAYGKLSVYMQRGEYQLNISSLRPMGLGDLQRQFELLKQRLAAEGLFDESRKKPVPYIPARIGLVTSPDGAALHDFLKISLSRFPTLDIKIYPAPVQGRGAERYIAAGVNFFNRYGKVDVIVVTRGGGYVLGKQQPILGHDLFVIQGIGQARHGILLCVKPVDVDSCTDRDQNGSGYQVLFPYFHKTNPPFISFSKWLFCDIPARLRWLRPR